VLLHITSLPGPYGIGDLGPAALDFIDFLVEAGQRYWQLLPLGPVTQGANCSPYMSLSAFAGNPLLISPALLLEEGLLIKSDLDIPPDLSDYQVNFSPVIAFKRSLLSRAFERLALSDVQGDFHAFCQQEEFWLKDYALFMALREQAQGLPWYEWDLPLVGRDPAALATASTGLAKTIAYYQFEQFLFFRQWQGVRRYANEQGVALIGDLPIYVSLDSADVWANQHCFQLDDKTSMPTHVAGVPPDYFSKTGQRWGNPIYRWKIGQSDNQGLYDWWRLRFRQMARLIDQVRIDHFRGFESYWQIPAAETTAIHGQWVKGPGNKFFAAMAAAIAELPIIAEDLGVITPEVIKLRDGLGFPGMKILHFAFDSDAENLYLPHNYLTSNCVVFTGTHDNNTTLGWYLGDCTEETRDRVRRYTHSDCREVHWDLIRLALSSVAATAIIPLQDLMGFGGDCRMNLPGTVPGNWLWRFAAHFLTPELAARMRDESEFYGRVS
jgi:4-alpha-glucanotransferase